MPSSPRSRQPGRWRRSGRCQGSPPAAGFLRTIGARHGCASRWLRSLLVMALYWRARHRGYPRRPLGNPIILRIGNDLEQSSAVPLRPFAEMMPSSAMMPADRVRQHRALTHQKLPAPVQHQGGLLLFDLDRHKPHRWPRHRLADRRRIVRVVLAALEIGLHIARRHQPHRVAKRLQLAAPMMRRGTRFNANQARRQSWQRTPAPSLD